MEFVLGLIIGFFGGGFVRNFVNVYLTEQERRRE